VKNRKDTVEGQEGYGEARGSMARPYISSWRGLDGQELPSLWYVLGTGKGSAKGVSSLHPPGWSWEFLTFRCFPYKNISIRWADGPQCLNVTLLVILRNNWFVSTFYKRLLAWSMSNFFLHSLRE
jgi:hypothetical protein